MPHLYKNPIKARLIHTIGKQTGKVCVLTWIAHHRTDEVERPLFTLSTQFFLLVAGGLRQPELVIHSSPTVVDNERALLGVAQL